MFSIDYRPDSWDDVVGNDSIIKSFRQRIAEDKPPQVYMLTGPSGTGKTTLARIAANVLGCEDFGIREINGSDNTGVDFARDLIQDIPMMPMVGDAKAYIIDEVDKTSDAWQSAMKKPLEDMPKNVYFFLCTEVPNKVKRALHTRSIEINLDGVDDTSMMMALKRVIRSEGLKTDPAVISSIINGAEGSVRQGLTLLEQVKDLSPEEAEEVIQIGVVPAEVKELCRALLSGKNWTTVGPIVKTVKGEPEGNRRAILGYMNAVLLNSGKARAFDIIDVFSDNLYDSGKAGFTAMCWELSNGS